MTFGGWIILALSVGGVTLLFGWCITRVLRTPDATTGLHGVDDIDTQDTDPG